MPLLLMYIFTVISIVFREVTLIWVLSTDPGISCIQVLQLAAKQCVGLIQTWMIYEISLNLRADNRLTKTNDEVSYDKEKACIRLTRNIVLGTLSAGFIG